MTDFRSRRAGLFCCFLSHGRVRVTPRVDLAQKNDEQGASPLTAMTITTHDTQRRDPTTVPCPAGAHMLMSLVAEPQTLSDTVTSVLS